MARTAFASVRAMNDSAPEATRTAAEAAAAKSLIEYAQWRVVDVRERSE